MMVRTSFKTAPIGSFSWRLTITLRGMQPVLAFVLFGGLNMSQQNPYSTGPQSTAPPPNQGVFRIDHGRTFHYIFENPNGMTNVLFCTLCNFIPILGPIVMHGYQFEVIEQLHRTRGATYPDFDFNRFGEYLSRGIWVFLVGLMIGIVFVPVIWILLLLSFGLASVLAAGNDVAFLILIPINFVVIVGVSFLMGMVLVPVSLRAGLQQEFSAAFDMNFAFDFIKNNFGQFIISGIIMYFLSFVITIVGFLALCIGVYFAVSIVYLMATHLMWQLYERHLSLGGQPIPLKQVPMPPQKF